MSIDLHNLRDLEFHEQTGISSVGDCAQHDQRSRAGFGQERLGVTF